MQLSIVTEPMLKVILSFSVKLVMKIKKPKLDYKLEQESLNTEIDQALNDYFSKNGGKGGNRPDAKLLLHANDGKYYPILIEYKGYKDKLVKLDAEGNVANKTSKNQPDFTNINSYAVNGAVHYSNAVLHYTSYTDVTKICSSRPFGLECAFPNCWDFNGSVWISKRERS